MTKQERLNEYIRKQCVNCANKDTDLCEIRVFAQNDTVYTKCVYYKRERNM